MKPHYYYDSIYSLTSMKKREDSHREFLFNFISDEWNKLYSEDNDNIGIGDNSFINQLLKVSKNGRNYLNEEILDHCGTMLVAVSHVNLKGDIQVSQR